MKTKLTKNQRRALQCAGVIMPDKHFILTARGGKTELGLANVILAMMCPDEDEITEKYEHCDCPPDGSVLCTHLDKE